MLFYTYHVKSLLDDGVISRVKLIWYMYVYIILQLEVKVLF